MKALSANKRKSVAGFLFVLPWLVGLLIFFIQPVLTFLRFSFTNFTLTSDGYILKHLDGGIFANYHSALFGDANFPIKFVNSFTNLLYQTPIIVLFSLFSAVLLTRKFKGRTVARLIFFLPIIVSSGVVSTIIQNDVTQIAMTSTSSTESMFDVSNMVNFLLESGLPEQFVNIISTVIANVADLIWSSSIQVMIFLIALLSIPQSYYEVANVEGATAWETFWKVTFPIISPFILAATVYTIIDSFVSYKNPVIRYIMDFAIRNLQYSYSAAMSWLYFIVVSILLLVVFLLFRKSVFYSNNDKLSKGEKRK